jgi:RimJ/RimL family protein N-acetyltransferase
MEIECQRAITAVSNAKIATTVLQASRLILRQQTTDDAEFIFALVNDPSWLRFIGDRGVHSVDDARNYILKGAMDSYSRHGFGLYVTALKDSGTPVGICGLVKRETLADVDIGFAFLPQYAGMGYAYESACAVMEHARNDIGLKRVIAITNPDNLASIRLLEKLGLTFERKIRVAADKDEINLFACSL